MLFRSTLALAALSATALAVPAPGPVDSQLVLNQAGKAALDWSAGRLSRLGEDGQVDAMTQWGWYDCGESFSWGGLRREGVAGGVWGAASSPSRRRLP